MENLNLRIAVVGIDYLQIYFPSSHEMQIITSDNICIGRINQSKTVLEKDFLAIFHDGGAKVFCQFQNMLSAPTTFYVMKEFGYIYIYIYIYVCVCVYFSRCFFFF